MAFGDVGHTLSNQGVGSSSNDWVCYNVSGSGFTGTYLYTRDNASGGNVLAKSFKFDNGQWLDVGGDEPTHFGLSVSDSTSITPTSTHEDLYVYNSGVLLAHLKNDGYDSSGSGGGSGGGGTNTEGSSYSATLEVNSSGWLEYTIPTTSSSGTYYLLKSSDGGQTFTQHGQSIMHGVLETQGSFVFDQTLIWIVRSPTEDELARWAPPSTTKKVFCNFW